MRLFVVLVAIITLLVMSSTVCAPCGGGSVRQESTEFYVGVTYCGNSTAEAKLLIDRVKSYTNLFVLQSWSINNLSKNETRTTEICNYAVNAGLNVIVQFGILNQTWHNSWLDVAEKRWGKKFLGVYYYDEPVGRYLEWDEENRKNFLSEHGISEIDVVGIEQDYEPILEFFFGLVEMDREAGLQKLVNRNITSFTSDFSLYWFGYLAGWDVIFAQIGWNHTVAQEIALVKGAARLQNKSWGTILTWKYDQPPYLDSGTEIYNQMRMSYEAGAEYVVIFNYPKLAGNEYGILKEEHFVVLERFWNEIVQEPDVVHGSMKTEATLVLPENFGWGMHPPEDKIWGWWEPDENAWLILEFSRILIAEYGLRLDIVYDDPRFKVTNEYQKVYYWNRTESLMTLVGYRWGLPLGLLLFAGTAALVILVVVWVVRIKRAKKI
ncbi:hypothetical protein KAI12_01935 [Candidatus Bathyarchaeota archaeon]|nr:hypothetical protein [Candidatus Bathyarchaeota archaeon]